MEYFQHGDLYDCLTSPLPEDEAKIITHQLLEGLVVMHENDFTHRDLKPQVISSFQYKISRYETAE